MKHLIEIENHQKEKAPFRGYKTALRRAIDATLSHQEFCDRALVSVSLVSREEIARLNSLFRGIDRPTDVLSFPLEEDERVGSAVPLGDVIVCPAVVAEHAEQFGTTYRQEFCLMVIHSTLHLLGWDHVEPAEKQEMFRLQERILSSLNEGEVQTEI